MPRRKRPKSGRTKGTDKRNIQETPIPKPGESFIFVDGAEARAVAAPHPVERTGRLQRAPIQARELTSRWTGKRLATLPELFGEIEKILKTPELPVKNRAKKLSFSIGQACERAVEEAKRIYANGQPAANFMEPLEIVERALIAIDKRKIVIDLKKEDRKFGANMHQSQRLIHRMKDPENLREKILQDIKEGRKKGRPTRP